MNEQLHAGSIQDSGEEASMRDPETREDPLSVLEHQWGRLVKTVEDLRKENALLLGKLQEQEASVVHMEQTLAAKEEALAAKEGALVAKEEERAAMEEELAAKEEEVASKTREIAVKEEEIALLNEEKGRTVARIEGLLARFDDSEES